MPQDPARLIPLIPGIRRVFVDNRVILGSSNTRFATALFPARTMLRSLYFAADASLSEATRISMRLAFGNTLTPGSDDFVGTGLIVPNTDSANAVAPYSADPGNSAAAVEYNYQLPDRNGRLLFEILNTNVVAVSLKIRVLLDGLSRIGM